MGTYVFSSKTDLDGAAHRVLFDEEDGPDSPEKR